MTNQEFFTTLRTAGTLGEALAAASEFVDSTTLARWVPVGGLENNRGPMEVSADPGRALVERVTNGIDAVLEVEHERHGGRPDCRSPREAAQAWLGVPLGGLSQISPRQRQDLANRVTIAVYPADGRNSRILEIRDLGIGLTAEQIPKTILSLNAPNKMTKHYLSGAYGQGGSSTYISCELTLIASRAQESDEIAFTVVKYQDLPADIYKTGHYVYLFIDGKVPSTSAKGIDFPPGTLVRHFGYKLGSYVASYGQGSVYGLLQQTLFDPVLPVWLENNVHGWRRVIKGSRNALNGALDDGDEGRGPSIDHNQTMTYIPLDENGSVGIEYWLLEKPANAKTKATAAYVNPTRPIVLTLNGQAQAELTSVLIRKDADMVYLATRLIVHIDCNFLTPDARRQLFVSNREAARSGTLLQAIQKELVDLLKSDDELVRLNSAARNATMRERDEAAVFEARRQVAQLLRLQGVDFAEIPAVAESKDNKGIGEKPMHPPRPRPVPEPIQTHEPPTYIRIVWPRDEAITFYPEQKRYIRFETDAPTKYHDPTNPQQSRINLIIKGEGSLGFRTTSALNNGRLRALCECITTAKVGAKGSIRVELSVPGQPTLSDEREFQIVTAPLPKEDKKAKLPLPQFDFRDVAFGSEAWATLDWPENVNDVASSMAMDEGMHVVYYSTDFPPFKRKFEQFERRNPQLAKMFENRYAVFLVVHSLLFQHHQEQAEAEGFAVEDEAKQDDAERRERIRVATLSAMYAAREVHFAETTGSNLEFEEV